MLEKLEAETIVSATDAKNDLDALLGRVTEQGETVIVERQGMPPAAIISIGEYRQLRLLQQDLRRREATANIRGLQAEVSERNKDLTPEQIETIAQQARSEITRGLFEKGLVKYKAK